ncbi:MAG TPA: preprotein translocase subunit SecD [Methanomicrobiales archaeon]|nr:preprotein translocase subunit SecD [Methanomicrobiales archaeon]
MAKPKKKREAEAAAKAAREQGPPKKEGLREVLRDWRVILLIVFLVGALVAIYPHYENGKFTTALQFGLDLQGGSWLQMSFDSEVVGFTSQRSADDLASSLSSALDSEVSAVSPTQLEVRKLFTRSELELLLAQQNATLTTYEQGVSQATGQDIKRILEQKINTLGTKDARVNLLTPVGTNVVKYVRVELAGVDINTARNIVGKQGLFEIRIKTVGNQTEHVLYGNAITSVGNPQQDPTRMTWGVPFTLSEQGAAAFRAAANDYGAVTDPAAHPISMILDNVTVFSAPLDPSLAKELLTSDVQRLSASTGSGTAGMNQAQTLEIHLRAGALPVDVAVANFGQVSAPLGEYFKLMSLVAGVLALLTVGFVIYYRYREPSIVLPMVGTNFAEVIILLGIARFVQQLDLASIAGLIAVVGTGIDQLVVITDEVLHEGKVPSPSLYLKRLGRALAIILVAAGTVVFAMLPLALMDLSTLKGFAFITILGVLVGVAVTRPAYGKIIMAILSGKS